MDIKTAFDEARPRHVAKDHGRTRRTHSWLIAALLREMSELEGKAMFECVERWLGSSWQMWRRFGQEWVSSWTSKVKRHISYVASCGPTTFGSCHTPKGSWNRCCGTWLKKRLGWTWHPSLRVFGGQVPTSPNRNCDLSMNTKSGCHRFSFEKKFKILGLA